MFKKYRIYLLGLILGAIGGWMYWNFVGCSSGHCLISSVWYNSTAYGGMMGILLAGSIKDYKPGKKKESGVE